MLPQRLKHFFQENNLMPGHKNYTKFIILGRSRTGSNFLRGLLRNHPQIVTSGEILRNEEEIDWDTHHYHSNQKIMTIYQNDPGQFLDQIVFKKFPKQIKAVGFKLFYYHAQNQPYQIIWDSIKQDHSIHILHIKRRNILKTHLSRAQANRSGSWVNITGVKEEHTPIVLDPEACRKDFEQTRQWETDFDQFFMHHPLKQIQYEELAAKFTELIPEIQNFLAVDPFPAIPQTYKQSTKHLSDSIKNFDTLKAYFSGTQWAEFFEE